MRLGVLLPFRDDSDGLLDGRAVLDAAQLIEDIGFDSAWLPDHLPLPGDGGRDRGDPLMYLALAATVTSRIELGTCIFAVPLRTKYDVAQRFYSLETLAPGRCTIGVGTGSQRLEYEANDLDWEGRFGRMRDHMAALPGLVAGERLELASANPVNRSTDEVRRFGEATAVADETWPMRTGMPRLVLGAWASDLQLKRAVAEYDGWMASAGPGSRVEGWKKILGESIARYRDLGGERAMCSTVMTDLSAPTSELDDASPFTLQCAPDVAAERLSILAELGYDDVILWPAGAYRNRKGSWYGWSPEHLAEMRALVPRDPSGPGSTGRAGATQSLH